ncbi:MAG: rhodanese-like domain-containing protein, partial [Acidimicrobiia bacterium]
AARSDLLTPGQTEPLARAAYRSIRDRLFTLPDELAVYPTHGSGSFCSVASGTERTTTIGNEKMSNPLLAGSADEDTFVRRLLAGYGTYPPYFLELREVNRKGPRVHGPTLASLPRLSVAELEKALTGGVELIDARSVEAFASGHIPGALSNPWRDSFATWLGWLVSRERPLVFVTDETVNDQDLAWAALSVGFENLTGVLAGGMHMWAESARPVSRIEIVTDPSDIDVATIIDVRQRSEYDQGHHPAAVHVELGSMAASAADLPPGDLLVHCGHGERAMTAASLLARAGHENVTVFQGGHEQLARSVAVS